MSLRCVYELAWSGPCSKDTKSDLNVCPEHLTKRCVVCDKHAVRECDTTMGPLVCGEPLCAEHNHNDRRKPPFCTDCGSPIDAQGEGHHYLCPTLRRPSRPPPAVVTSATLDVRAVRRLVDAAIATADHHEATKRLDEPELVEVQLHHAAKAVDELLRKIGA